MESPTFRKRHRSHFLVRWDAVITCVVSSAVAFVLGMAFQWHIIAPLIIR